MAFRRWRGAAICWNDDFIPQLGRVKDRLQNAGPGGHAGHNERLDSLLPQREIEVGAKEGTEHPLFDDDVSGSRLQFLDDCRSSSSPNGAHWQAVAFLPVEMESYG